MVVDIEKNIAQNIKELRQLSGLKQAELGEKISYSDKTISKWENGTSVPDITALMLLAETFGVTVDDLARPNACEKVQKQSQQAVKEETANDIAMLCLSVVTVFLIAVIIYVGLLITDRGTFWQVFVWAVPPSVLLAFRFNRSHFNLKWLNCCLLSIFVWSLITAIYLQLLVFSYNVWPLFFVGIPLQAMIVIYSFFSKKRRSLLQILFKN